MTLHTTMLSYIAARDQRLMVKLNGWRAPRWIRVWMICATRGGDGWLWYLMGIIIAFFGGENRFEAIGAAAMSAFTGLFLFLKLKRIFNRRRPVTVQPHCWATLLPPDQFSFPSGHTITAFAVAIPFLHFYPALGFGLLFCAGSIALSRILLGLHYLTDVVAGALIGVALGLAAAAIV